MGLRPPASYRQPENGVCSPPSPGQGALSAAPKDNEFGNGVAPPGASVRLDSWKDIAAYLGRGVRTVIRWEQAEGLPVHRLPHQKLGSVYAYSHELDAWLADRSRAGEPLDPGEEPFLHRLGLRGGRRWMVGMAAAIPVIVLLVWLAGRFAGSPAETTLAVLPFQNEDANPAVAPLCSGIAEGIIRDLARLRGGGTRVVSYSAVGSVAQDIEDPVETARRLHVDTLLVGRLAERRDRLIVSVELVNAADQTVLWSARYDRSAPEMLAIQREITAEIVRHLQFGVSPGELRRLTQRSATNPEAYRHYARGRYLWNQRTPEGMKAAIEAFHRAIEADPAFAMAWSGLADAYVPLAYYVSIPTAESAPKARAAAEQALKLDLDLADAFAARAYVQADYYWDWEAAERDFRRAVELNPGSAHVHHWYGERLALTGRTDEALAEYLVALELDPLSLIINTNVAHAYYFAGDYPRAIEHLQEVIRLNDSFPNAHADLGRALLMTRQYPEAIRELERATELGGGPVNGLGRLGYAYAVAGRREDALRILERIHGSAEGAYVAPLAAALVYLGLGDREKAIQWLTRAVNERAVYVTSIAVDPLFDGLREDAQFTALLRRMNLVR
jgi:TolB-like protein/tetratricopeptide (TPR) repeat protein